MLLWQRYWASHEEIERLVIENLTFVDCESAMGEAVVLGWCAYEVYTDATEKAAESLLGKPAEEYLDTGELLREAVADEGGEA